MGGCTSIKSNDIRNKKGVNLSQIKPDPFAINIYKKDFDRNEEDFDCPDAELINKAKSPQDVKDIKSAISDHFLFRHLNEDIVDELISSIRCYNLQKNELVYHQGDLGYNFFIICSGIVNFFVNDIKVKTFQRGQGFGEIALLHKTDRRGTAITLTKVILWVLGRDDFRRIITIGNQRNYLENKSFLVSVPVFSDLTETQLEALLSSLTIQTFNPSEMIINAGDYTPEFYLIKKGVVNIYRKSENIIYLKKGEYFGEQALIYNTSRVASVKAIEKTTLISFTYETLTKALGQKLELTLYFNTIRIAFSKDPLLSKLTKNQTTKIISKIIVKELNGKSLRYPSEELWVLIKGTATENNITWTSHQCVSSNSLLLSSSYMAEVETNNSVVGIILKSKIEKILRSKIQTRIKNNKIVELLKSTHVFNLIPENSIEKLSSKVSVQFAKQGECIFSEGDPGEKLFILKHGEVSIIKEGVSVNVLKKGEFFGERALLFSEPRTATVVALVDSKLITVERTNFLNILDENLKEYLYKKSHFQDLNVGLNDLNITAKIAEGTHSQVYLAKNKKNNLNYALKCIGKDKVTQHKLLQGLITEKEIHSRIDFPFISHLVKTLKNNEKLFFLYEFIPGPSLKLSVSLDQISIKLTSFYTSIILLTLKYLHERNIVHRRIVPDSFILDTFGYPILVNFASSKVLEGRTYTLVGVPHYIAPEVIKGDGYTFYSDIWSLGIMIYEFLFGFMPFGDKKEDPFEIYKSILEDPLTYSVFVKDSMKMDGLINQLLQKVPALRGTAKSILDHRWFEGTPWDALFSKQIIPDFIPNIAKPYAPASLPSFQVQNSDEDWAQDF